MELQWAIWAAYSTMTALQALGRQGPATKTLMQSPKLATAQTFPSPLKTGEGACPTYGRALGRCSPAYQYPLSGVGAACSELGGRPGLLDNLLQSN